jgi:hypothetical protein
MTTVWPVLGMRVRQPMHLDDEQCFRPLTEQEKLSVLNLKIIDLFEGPTVLDTSQTDWYGFVLNERFEKFFGNSETTPQNFMERYNCRDKCLEMFLSVAPVVGGFVAYHGGGHAPAPRLLSRGMNNRQGSFMSGSWFLVPTPRTMTKQKCCATPYAAYFTQKFGLHQRIAS